MIDRKRLFQVVDEEGEVYFVQAESFAEAHAKFQKWSDPSGEEVHVVQAVLAAGWLVGPEMLCQEVAHLDPEDRPTF